MADSGTLPRTELGSAPADRNRANRRAAVDVITRAVLVVTAATAALLDAPTWLRTALTLVALVAITEWVVRRRGRGLLDAALVGAAGLVVAAVLLGLVLNLTPAGLTRQSWAVGAGVIGLVALATGLRGPAVAGVLAQARAERSPATGDTSTVPGPRGGTSIVVGIVCALLTVGVVGVSFVVAAASTRENQIAPLQMSTVQTDGRITGVTLSSGTTAGPYDLVVVADGAATTAAAGFSLDGTPRTVPVTVPTVGRALINLVPAGSATPVRQLIVDGGQLAEADPTVPAAPSVPTGDTTTDPGAPLQMVPTETDGRITAVTLSSGALVGPYDLIVRAEGTSTMAAPSFYLDDTPRTVPVTVPAAGPALIDLVPVGSDTPVLELTVEDGRLVG